MSSETLHFHLERLDRGEDLSTDDWKFGGVDRALIDRLLYLATSGHHHTGLPVVDAVSPTLAPLLTAEVGAGTLPAGADIQYLYSLVDGDGGESASSPVATVSTEDPVVTPAAPTISRFASGGSLAPGQYFYALSAFRGFDTLETAVGPSAVANLPAVDGATQRVNIVFPTLPDDADGFNIYRRAPGYPNYVFLASIETPLTSYIDTGLVLDDCNRLAPFRNTTSNTSTVTVDLAELPPDGFSWRLYRTMIAGQWSATLLTTVGPGITSYVDVGNATTTGEPQLDAIDVVEPQPINLEYGSGETQGSLSPVQVGAFPQLITFAYPGTVVAIAGTFVWTCPFTQAIIRDVTLSLGRGSYPTTDDLQVDVLVSHGVPGATPIAADEDAYDTIFDGPYAKLTTGLSSQITEMTEDDDVDLNLGDRLSLNVVVGDATATDLLVTLRLWAQETGIETIDFPT